MKMLFKENDTTLGLQKVRVNRNLFSMMISFSDANYPQMSSFFCRTLSHETRLGLRNSAIAFQRPWKGSFQLYDPFQMKGRRQAMP